MKGAGIHFSSLDSSNFHSLSTSPLLYWLPRASYVIATLFTPPAASRHKWPHPFRKKACHAGQRRALELVSMLPTVDAALPHHLEPHPRASRGASTSASRHHAGPLGSPSLSPSAARAQSLPARPMLAQLLWPRAARPAPPLSPRHPRPLPRTPPSPPFPL